MAIKLNQTADKGCKVTTVEKIPASSNGFWCVMPHYIIEDTRLSSTEKIIYAEISSLVRKEGYCFARNSHFAKLLSLSTKQISVSVSKLHEVGYIDVRIDRKQGNYRKIYLRPIEVKVNSMEEKVKRSLPKGKEGYIRKGKELEIHNIEIHKDNTNVLHKPKVYGRPDINESIKFFEEQLEGRLDGSQKENRRYCKLILDRLKKSHPAKKAVNGIRALLQVGLQDSFHGKNLTSMKYLFYNMQKIKQAYKKKEPKLVVIS